MKPILVTGASGFVGKHVVGRLLAEGYLVRGTIRGQDKAASIRSAMEASVPGMAEYLTLVQADLLSDSGWTRAMDGVEAVIHVAAPVPTREPSDKQSLIRPIVEGTERVLRFAQAAGVRRVVMTASIATIGYGHAVDKRFFTESDFTDLTRLKSGRTYVLAKTRAERAAWTYCRGQGIDLTTIHPGVILGPAQDGDLAASLSLVSALLDGSIPAVPRVGFAICDVRDVAAMHVAALQNPSSIGQRYLCTGPFVTLMQLADILRSAYPEHRVTRWAAPDWLVRLLAPLDPLLAQIAGDLGKEKNFNGRKGSALMGQPYRTPQEAVLSAAESLIRLGLVKEPRHRARS